MAVEGAKTKGSPIVVLFMLGAVAFAAVAGWLTSRLLGETYSQEPLRPVVVAAHDLAAGRRLVKGDLAISQWPISSVPDGAFTSSAKLLDAKVVPLVPLARGVAVVAAQVSRPNAGLGVAAELSAGKRAMAIQIDSATTLARLIYPGARVDVLSTLRARGGQGGAAAARSKTILQNVAVLAVGPEIDAASAHRAGSAPASSSGLAAAGDEQERRLARSMVTLAVTPAQAERLVFARREGAIDLVLRSPKDDEDVATSGASLETVLGAAPAANGGTKAARASDTRDNTVDRAGGRAPTAEDWGLPAAARKPRSRRRR